jgi:hypothetical protein
MGTNYRNCFNREIHETHKIKPARPAPLQRHRRDIVVDS